MSNQPPIAKVKEDHSLFRDGRNKAIVNRNTGDYHRRLASKHDQQKGQRKIQDLEDRVAKLEALVADLQAKLQKK